MTDPKHSAPAGPSADETAPPPAGASLGSGGGTDAPSAGPGVRATESVAGEEDPGASVDMTVPPGGARKTNPGDQAPAGTPGTGEAPCPRCGGSGQLAGQRCPECAGTGKIVQGIGGA